MGDIIMFPEPPLAPEVEALANQIAEGLLDALRPLLDDPNYVEHPPKNNA